MPPDQSTLFRAAAIEHQRRRLAGEVVVAPTRRLSLLLLGYAAIVVIAVAGLQAITVPVNLDGLSPAVRSQLLAAAQVGGACQAGTPLRPSRCSAHRRLDVRPLSLVSARFMSLVLGGTGTPRGRS